MEAVSLSALTESDLPKLYQWRNDADLATLMMANSKTYSPEEVKEWLERTNADSCQRLLGIFDENTNQYIGLIRFMFIDWMSGTADLGILIGDPEQRNKGKGSQALFEAIEYAFNILKLRRLTLKVLDSNSIALAVYKKFGFVKEGVMRACFLRNGKLEDAVIMGLLKEEFKVSTKHTERKIVCTNG